jgi:hypothetical protein
VPHFQIIPLDPSQFASWFSLSDVELAARGARRCVVDANPGYPCRVSLEDASIGEEVLLLAYAHHDVDGPYRASGPIYVRAAAQAVSLAVDEVPRMLRHRLLSLRAYDRLGLMREAVVTSGERLEDAVRALLAEDHVAYVDIHNAKPGCFNCRAVRVN